MVKRAADAEPRSIADMGVNHCRGDVFVSEQFLHRTDVVATLQQVRGKTMPECVAAGGLGNPGGANGVFHGVLQVLLRHMVPALFAAARIDRKLISRKSILPDPFACGIWIFAVKSRGQEDPAAPAGEILPVHFLDSREMDLERPDESLREEGDAFPHSLGLAHRNLAVAKIDVFDPQSQTFEQPQTAPVEKMDHEAVVAFELREHSARLRAGEDDRNLGWAFNSLYLVDEVEFPIEDLLVEEKEGAEGLVLGRGGDMFLDREVSEKLRDLLLAHLLRMAFAVEEDVAPDPIEVDLFGADRVVLEAKVPAHAVEQFGFERSEGRGRHLSPMIL